MSNLKKNIFTRLALIIMLLVLTNFTTIAINSKSASNKQVSTSDIQYDLLIITPKIFSKYLNPLVHHKNEIGIKTIMVNLEDIYNQMFLQGRDEPEKIKYFIKEAIETWHIKYVLLVGGIKIQSSPSSEKWWLPVRYSHIEDCRYEGLVEKKFISDLYYADIYDKNGNFSSWDTNNNGIFGEWLDNKSADDIIDLQPDVYVGRLPCSNIFEVKTMVKKIINYESKNCQDSWFKKMVVVAGDTYPDINDYCEGELYTKMALDMMPGFSPIKLWASDGSLKNWVDVVKNINKGCGFIYFSGHGDPLEWATHPYRDSKKYIFGLGLTNMLFLNNKDMLPICIVGGCHNSMFNISFFNTCWLSYLHIPKCWSWALTSKINGGSIATIGPTGLSYGPTDISSGEGGSDWLDMHFFDEYGLKGKDILGETWGNTIVSFLQNFSINWNEKATGDAAMNAKNVEQWVLIGDPSLKIGGYINNNKN